MPSMWGYFEIGVWYYVAADFWVLFERSDDLYADCSDAIKYIEVLTKVFNYNLLGIADFLECSIDAN